MSRAATANGGQVNPSMAIAGLDGLDRDRCTPYYGKGAQL